MLDVALLQLWYFRSPSWFLHFVFDHLFLKSHCHFSGPFRMLNFTALRVSLQFDEEAIITYLTRWNFFPPVDLRPSKRNCPILWICRFFSPFVWGKPFLHKRNPCTNVIITEHIRLHMKKKKEEEKNGSLGLSLMQDLESLDVIYRIEYLFSTPTFCSNFHVWDIGYDWYKKPIRRYCLCCYRTRFCLKRLQ